MAKYSGDPREMVSRFDGHCPKCDQPIHKGERIIYYPNGRKAYHYACVESDYLKSLSAMTQEDFGCSY